MRREQIISIENGLLILAPAKINLSLLIAGKRPDGFHEIETVMAKIDLYDEILIQPGHNSGIEFICKGPCWAPNGPENLVYRAAEMLMENCKIDTGVKITLTKNIPAGSGLGSASSDAAAALMGLNKFLKLELDRKTLAKTATQLGSDVPFFLGGPLALCTGKGEKIQKMSEIFDFLALLVLPDVNVSTKKVYANYRHDLALYEKLSNRINGYIRKNRIDLLAKECVNMLEASSFKVARSLAGLKDILESLNIGPWNLSGSGSAMFCLVESGDEEEAIENKSKIGEKVDCTSAIVRNNRW
ncbi:MAG: 4-(cytidine 5'-diphospho)-2-C-methyl-D-erythritol kinase [Sedimentisphaerales bacterium]|nr:4-(cytidine 5'-diphospho)-2-C-methyl-D-erythritol kinase [Sedimentisphaerales bacterium]